LIPVKEEKGQQIIEFIKTNWDFPSAGLSADAAAVCDPFDRPAVDCRTLSVFIFCSSGNL
jgi:hypothetical protein